jgi:hypothetical protein
MSPGHASISLGFEPVKIDNDSIRIRAGKGYD